MFAKEVYTMAWIMDREKHTGLGQSTAYCRISEFEKRGIIFLLGENALKRLHYENGKPVLYAEKL